MNEQEWIKQLQHLKDLKRGQFALQFVVESIAALRDATKSHDDFVQSMVLSDAFPALHIIEERSWQEREVELQCRAYLMDFANANGFYYKSTIWKMFAHTVHQIDGGIRDTLVAHMAGMAEGLEYDALQKEVRNELQAELADRYDTSENDDENEND